MEFYSNIVGFVDNFDNYLVRDYLLDDTVFTRKGKISYRDAVMYPLVEKRMYEFFRVIGLCNQ